MVNYPAYIMIKLTRFFKTESNKTNTFLGIFSNDLPKIGSTALTVDYLKI